MRETELVLAAMYRAYKTAPVGAQKAYQSDLLSRSGQAHFRDVHAEASMNSRTL